MKVKIIKEIGPFKIGDIVDLVKFPSFKNFYGSVYDRNGFGWFMEIGKQCEIVEEENKDKNITDDLQNEINEWTIKTSELENKIIELENKNKELQHIINTTVVENERRLRIPVYSLDELKELKELFK